LKSGDAPFFVVDAFTEESFRGNPAGVVVLEAPNDAPQALAIAREVNPIRRPLSCTA
jgi:predicted PhzF superfamily epimerase YddE/YHI9